MITSAPASQIQLAGPFDEPAAGALLRELALEALRSNNTEQLRYVAGHPQTPNDVLMLLCHRDDCRDELGHRKSPRALLNVLAEVYEYPEARLTLGINFYTNDDESPEAFAAFLNRHGDSHGVLRSLIYVAASSSAKDDALAAAISQHSDASELQAIHQELNDAQRATDEVDADELRRLYETNSPRVWKALAANPHTPKPLLESLADVKAIKSAREIRQLATTTLAK